MDFRSVLGVLRQTQRFFKEPARTARQDIAGPKGAAAQAADGAAHIGGAASHDLGHVETACYGQVGAAPGGGLSETHPVPFANPKGAPLGSRPAVYRQCHGRACNGDVGGIENFEVRTQEGDFQGRTIGLIAHQQIGSTMGKGVQSAGNRNPHVLIAETALVLYGGERSGPVDAKSLHHGPPSCMSLLYPSCEIATNRRLSPVWYKNGRSRPASNSFRGVRPIRRHPPGLLRGYTPV